MSDAGTPLIADPGYLVREAARRGDSGRVIPGASALTAALAGFGLRSTGSPFSGSRLRERASGRRFSADWQRQAGTLVLFEAPQRLRPTLEDVREHLGDRMVVLARELTKVHESWHGAGSPNCLSGALEERGEYVIVVADQRREPKRHRARSATTSCAIDLGIMTKTGAYSARDAVARAGRRTYQIPKRAIYKADQLVTPLPGA